MSDVQELIEKGQNLVDEVKTLMKNREYNFDLTAKWELKSDCKEIERYIKLISSGKASEKNITHLEKIIVHLQTIVNGLVEYYIR